jgi:aconitate hydratase
VNTLNSFGAASTLTVEGNSYRFYSLETLAKGRLANISRIPYSIKILLENLLRCEDGRTVKAADIEYVAQWQIGGPVREINFRPARVLLQDFTGVPCVVDLAAMRDALRDLGSDPKRANPLIPVDLVIDHSVQVDQFGSKDAFAFNALLEFQLNQERVGRRAVFCIYDPDAFFGSGRCL